MKERFLNYCSVNCSPEPIDADGTEHRTKYTGSVSCFTTQRQRNTTTDSTARNIQRACSAIFERMTLMSSTFIESNPCSECSSISNRRLRVGSE